MWANPEAIDLASSILKDRSADSFIRKSAAVYLLRVCTPEAVDPALDFLEENKGTARGDYYTELVAPCLGYPSLSSAQIKRLFALQAGWADEGVSRSTLHHARLSDAWAAVEVIRRGLSRGAEHDAMFYLSRVCKVVPEWNEYKFDEFTKDPSKWRARILDWWEKEGKQKYGTGD
jgi:hypothetical protein